MSHRGIFNKTHLLSKPMPGQGRRCSRYQSARRQLQGARTQIRCPLRPAAGLHALPALVLDGSFHFAAITCRILVSTSSTRCCEILDTSRTASLTYMVGERGPTHALLVEWGLCYSPHCRRCHQLPAPLLSFSSPAAGKAGILFVKF